MTQELPAEADRLESKTHGPGRSVDERPVVRGKFLYAGKQKLWIKGVTYGTFRPDDQGNQYQNPARVERDFAAMAATGINTVRTYTVPPGWLLDIARQQGLRVMVGLAWEQHITFLDNAGRARSIENGVRQDVRSCSGHPAILCYTIGNEIPASIVRWHGHRRIERFLVRLYRAVKQEDPTALVTYVNFPTTEYLRLPFLDFVCFNVYLEAAEKLEAYLARLQNLAEEQPLVLAEIGLDSQRNGESQQASTLAWQIATAFANGCAGAFVFAWTDEWYRGGYDIEDWDFGLTRRDREPKMALEAVRKAFAMVPVSSQRTWPRVSVVVCSYNGAGTIRDTLEGLTHLDYPDYEVIVVDDGSTDATAKIAAQYDVRLISTENRGLSNARNLGWQLASGEIVAYTDDDAYPDPHWLTYLVSTFVATDYVGVGGPNLAPPGDGPIAECVANAPGGPVHVLISDRVAEHIPGCNMAFRRSALKAVGGFDPRYRTAGDDVDICWRLQERGETIGFHPAAMVWHHRRNCMRTYWKQQLGYGRAEALLEEKWPERYNTAGHFTWSGRLYGRGLTRALRLARSRIYQGTWGAAPFQSLYEPAPGALLSLPLMPEWYLLIALLMVLGGVGVLWHPLLYGVAPMLLTAIAVPVTQAVLGASRASFPVRPLRWREEIKRRALVALLHCLQPMARLIGRLRYGLTPWRRRGLAGVAGPWPRNFSLWSESWKPPESWLWDLQKQLRLQGAVLLVGGDYDNWDLSVRTGPLCKLRIRMTLEEHGGGRQLLKFRSWPKIPGYGIALLGLFTVLTGAAFLDGALSAAALLGGAAIMIALQAIISFAMENGAFLSAFKRMADGKTTTFRKRGFAPVFGMVAALFPGRRRPNVG